MKKHIVFTGVMFMAMAMTGEAMAACSVGAGWSRIQNLEGGMTISGAPLGRTACNSSGQGTQEEHHADHTLWDYKMGNGHPVDPRTQVGTWSVANNNTTSATISYVYSDGGPSGPYGVYSNGSVADFCNGSSSVGLFSLPATTGTSRVCP